MQAAVHDIYMLPFFQACEEAATSEVSSASLAQLIDECRQVPQLASSSHLGEDSNLLRDGTLKRARTQMVELASRWSVKTNELEEKNAEQCNAAGK